MRVRLNKYPTATNGQLTLNTVGKLYCGMMSYTSFKTTSIMLFLNNTNNNNVNCVIKNCKNIKKN